MGLGGRVSRRAQSGGPGAFGHPRRFRRHQKPRSAALASGALRRANQAAESRTARAGGAALWRAGGGERPRATTGSDRAHSGFPAANQESTSGGCFGKQMLTFLKRGHGLDARRGGNEGAE